MSERKTVKTWTKTGVQNLAKHRSGSYYARTFSGGKEIWKSLKTSHFSVAKARLTQVVSERREQAESKAALTAGKMTFGEAAAHHLMTLDANPEIKETTRHYSTTGGRLLPRCSTAGRDLPTKM